VLVLVGGTVWGSRRMVLERGIRRDVGLDDASQTPDQLQLHLQTLYAPLRMDQEPSMPSFEGRSFHLRRLILRLCTVFLGELQTLQVLRLDLCSFHYMRCHHVSLSNRESRTIPGDLTLSSLSSRGALRPDLLSSARFASVDQWILAD